MLGNWKGYYRFDNERIQKVIGYNETEFEIVIDKFDGKEFFGKVNDDEKTGGMKDTGEIIGRLENNEVYFKKIMPRNCSIALNGERVYSEKNIQLFIIQDDFLMKEKRLKENGDSKDNLVLYFI